MLFRAELPVLYVLHCGLSHRGLLLCKVFAWQDPVHCSSCTFVLPAALCTTQAAASCPILPTYGSVMLKALRLANAAMMYVIRLSGACALTWRMQVQGPQYM